ncbi:MAG: peptidoglycan-binding protein [Symploca sp. SIO1C2]|nr:peptidoglycan-binding protein [Symploca sp. SIO1C2]NER45400.1 peptidoglycan-binding protein [Symploca sp. SIO1A3]
MAKSMMLDLASTSCLVCWSLLSGLSFTLEEPVVAAEAQLATTMIAQGIPAAVVERPMLKIGSKGKAVAELQAALKLLGYYTGAVDGIYAENTASAVSLFQETAGIAVDGITGPATWDHLFPDTPSAANSFPTTSNNSTTAGNSLPTTSNKPTTNVSSPVITPNNPATLPAATSSDNSAASFPIPTALQTTPRSNTRSNSPPATISRTRENTQPTSIDLPILKKGMRGSAISRLQDRLRALGFLQEEADGVFGVETLAAVKAAQSNFQLEPDGIVGPSTWRALLR